MKQGMPRRYWYFWWLGYLVEGVIEALSGLSDRGPVPSALGLGLAVFLTCIWFGLKGSEAVRPRPYAFYWSIAVFIFVALSAVIALASARWPASQLLDVFAWVMLIANSIVFGIGGLVVVGLWIARKRNGGMTSEQRRVFEQQRLFEQQQQAARVQRLINGPTEPTKRCPMCGEEILAVARKCKHCGEFLETQTL